MVPVVVADCVNIRVRRGWEPQSQEGQGVARRLRWESWGWHLACQVRESVQLSILGFRAPRKTVGPCTTGQHMPAAGLQAVLGTLMAGAAGRWPQVTQSAGQMRWEPGL